MSFALITVLAAVIVRLPDAASFVPAGTPVVVASGQFVDGGVIVGDGDVGGGVVFVGGGVVGGAVVDGGAVGVVQCSTAPSTVPFATVKLHV
jgi:hypothetical protein